MKTPDYQIHLGDCLETLRTLPDNSVDSVVCDPPYGLSKEPDMAEVLRHWLAGDDYQHKGGGFMGKTWDSFVPGPSVWKECLRVLKPGGHLLAFFGTRTQDLGTLAIRLAGFEIRDSIAWVYSSGFPKSLDVSKAIDKAAGAEREVVGLKANYHSEGKRAGTGVSQHGVQDGSFSNPDKAAQITAPATEAARQWQGWGTALKPALEPITVARKPLAKGHTVAANVMAHGTGALNIDGCRVATGDKLGGGMVSKGRPCVPEGWDRPWMHDAAVTEAKKLEAAEKVAKAQDLGRWPANLIHDGSDEVVALFPAQAGAQAPVKGTEPTANGFSGAVKFSGMRARVSGESTFRGDLGSAARFFYCAKAGKRDRNEGLDDMQDAVLARSCQAQAEAKRGNTVEKEGGAFNKARVTKNNHPTVKPTDLMAYLCRLVTPPGGTVLDPFMGSGSTGKAAIREGFNFIGCELDAGYAAIATARLEHEKAALLASAEKPAQSTLFGADA